MGCKQTKVVPVQEPVVRQVDVDVDHNQKVFLEEYGDDDPHEGFLVPQNILPDELTIHELTNTDNQVKIKPTDPQAFNTSFIQQRQQAIDNRSYRSTIESWKPTSLQQLAKMIQSFAQGKSIVDQHWIIFYWIVHNIAYDTVSYFSKSYADQSAEGVFQNRKGVCAGYGNLYKYLCDQLQLPCEIVSGYSKGYGFDTREGAPTETDHAWNAVQVDRHWYLMESTWAAGSLTKEKVFERKLNTYYFFPRPEEMIYHHLPEEEKWQLLRNSINMDEYMKMPKYRPSYFDLKLKLIHPFNRAHVNLQPNKPYALVLIQAPSNVHLLTDLKLNDEKIEGGHHIIYDKRTKLYCCYYAPPNKGKYKITIFGKQDDEGAGKYDGVIELTLNIDEMPTNPISFPKTWDTYSDLGLEVLASRSTHLIRLDNGKGSIQIRIRVPSDVLLLGRLENEKEEKIEGGHCVYYDKEKGYWRCKFAPDRNGIFEALIMAKTESSSGNYTSAISYKIDAKNIPSPPVSYPETWQLFYDLNMKIVSPHNQSTIVIPKTESEVEIHVKTSKKADLIGQLTDDNDQKVSCGYEIFYDRSTGYWRCKFAPNHRGLFKALIMGKRKSDPGHYTTAIAFRIDATKCSSTSVSYPETWPLFYEFKLKVIAPMNSGYAIWPRNASYAEVLVQAPDDVTLSCAIEYSGTRIENGSIAQFDSEKKLWQLLFAPEVTGQHDLIIFAQRTSNEQAKSDSVAQLKLDVDHLQQRIKFPLIYTSFRTNRCRIYTPLNGILKKGATVPFHCVIPGAVDANIATDGKLLRVEGYTNPILQRQITVGSKDVTIYGKYGSKESYDGLVKYTVQ